MASRRKKVAKAVQFSPADLASIRELVDSAHRGAKDALKGLLDPSDGPAPESSGPGFDSMDRAIARGTTTGARAITRGATT